MKEPGLEQIGASYRRATELGLISEDDTVVIWFDLGVFADRLDRVRTAFPAHFRHAVAVKANPLPSLMGPAIARGFGIEAASFGELALGAGINGVPFLVWDSPVKTAMEVARCRFGTPLLVNFDSLGELELLAGLPADARAGLRVNPQVGEGAIAATSVSGEHSKFGEPIANRDGIVEAFVAHPRLGALHVHVGSQGIDCSKLVQGVRVVLDLMGAINAARVRARLPEVRTIDIGGGWGVDYGGSSPRRIEDYAAALLAGCPELADPGLEVITEFGRYYHAPAGYAMSRIAQVKQFPGRQVIVHHAGADLFVRESYNREQWPHRIAIYDDRGGWLSGETIETDLGGPLCFGGDYIGRGIALPRASAGQWLVVRDAGANTFSLWSHHCSRPFPKVIACDDRPGAGRVVIAKPRQEISEVVDFWR